MAIRGPLTPQRVASASSAATSPAAAAVASPPTQSEGPWRRVWCVLQDSALAFFEHERAAANITAEPIATYEWLHFRSLRLAPSTSAARSSPSGSSFASADFELTLSDGRHLSLRTDSPTQRALWVRELLRLASWRAVHLLQLELTSDWHSVAVEAPAVHASLASQACAASTDSGDAWKTATP